jgi:peptidoglycan hydrolase-like protein with peptidoglycan-binding domain
VKRESDLTWPVLKLGFTSVDVTAAKHLLTCRGFPADAGGTFDGPTEFDDTAGRAASDFRSKMGLTPKKEIDGDTWDYLTNDESMVSEDSSPQMRDCVIAAQIELRKQKARPMVTVDGIFGSNTKAATIDFQNRVGGDPDGIVGPATWKNLVCRRPPS